MTRPGVWLATLLFAAGCASTSMHVPTPVPITDKMLLNEFRTSSRVSLINAAQEPDDRKWTESVVSFLAEQLQQRGAEVVEDAPRHLQLEIVKVRRIVGAVLLAPLAAPEGCEVAVRVTTGDGYAQEVAKRAGAYAWQKACDKGVTGIVVDILNDPNVRRYLELSDAGDES